MTIKRSAVWLALVAAYCWQVGWAQFDDSDEDLFAGLQKCTGGYCIKLHLCMNGTIVGDGEGVIETGLRINVDTEPNSLEECDFLTKCCRHEANQQPTAAITAKPFTINPTTTEDTTEIPLIIPPPSTAPLCGEGHPRGFVYEVSNGTYAQYAEFPWMAGLYSKQGAEEKYFCGGSLIHAGMVMTAAHCLANISAPQQLTVRLGDWDAVHANEPHIHQDIAVKKIIIHEQFNNRNFQNDIALLVLSEPASLNEVVNLICLPEPEDAFDGQHCIATGWGKSPRENKYNEILKKVSLPVIERRQCQSMLRRTDLGPVFRLHRTFMCAGGEEGVDACQGDGGAPLMCQKPGGKEYVQAGIVAWGRGCGVKDVPGVYVKVAHFVDWIQEQMVQEGLAKGPQPF